MDLKIVQSSRGYEVKFVVWHGGRKHVACLRTVKSIVENVCRASLHSGTSVHQANLLSAR